MRSITAEDFYKAAVLMHQYCAAQACCSGCEAEDVCLRMASRAPEEWSIADADDEPEEE